MFNPDSTCTFHNQKNDDPDVTRLTTERTTFVKPTNGSRPHRIGDDWTTKRQATLNMEWVGSTNFEENITYKDEFILDDPEEAQEARRAPGIPAPQQPTNQENLNTNSHTYLTGIGAQSASKARDNRTITQNKQPNSQ